jgi:hypothetical protein
MKTILSDNIKKIRIWKEYRVVTKLGILSDFTLILI